MGVHPVDRVAEGDSAGREPKLGGDWQCHWGAKLENLFGWSLLRWSSPGDSVADGLWAALPEAEPELEAAGAACAERENAVAARSTKVFAYIVSKRFKSPAGLP